MKFSGHHTVILGGWASIYIESPLRTMDPKQPMPALISIKLVAQLCAMEQLASIFTDNPNIHYRNVRKTSICVFTVQKFMYNTYVDHSTL